MKKNTLYLTIVGALFLAAGIYFGAMHDTSNAPPNSAQSTSVPQNTRLLMAQTLPDAMGKMQDLSQWKGKHLIVNFWATWCPPCVEEMPELNKLQQDMASRNIQVLGLGIDSPEKIKEFSIKHHISYPLYIAGMNGAELSRMMGNDTGGLPYTLLISADGEVKKKYLGKLKMEELRADIQALLKP